MDTAWQADSKICSDKNLETIEMSFGGGMTNLYVYNWLLCSLWKEGGGSPCVDESMFKAIKKSRVKQCV